MDTSNLPGMGWIPDVPSVKDYDELTPEIATLLADTAVPRMVSIASATPGPISAGGGAAAAAAPALAPTMYFEKRSLNRWIDASRLFVYKVTRNVLGWTGDYGAYIRTTMGTLACFGAPPERYWPYDGSRAMVNTRFGFLLRVRGELQICPLLPAGSQRRYDHGHSEPCAAVPGVRAPRDVRVPGIH